MSNTLREDEWFTIEQAAQYLKVSTSSLYRWRDEGRLKFYRLGPRTVRVRKCDLDALAEPEEQLTCDEIALRNLWGIEARIEIEKMRTEGIEASDSVKIVRQIRREADKRLQNRS